eukprot:COSAG01_NODE_1073_length_11862_cov_11.086117_7_plen_63_part_00
MGGSVGARRRAVEEGTSDLALSVNRRWGGGGVRRGGWWLLAGCLRTHMHQAAGNFRQSQVSR